MNATSLYVSASRLLFQLDTDNANYTDLYRLVPYLRQSLSCTVCANLLVEPYSPQDVCQHHVCRSCIGGRKNLKPTCVSCKNYGCYQPNNQLRILLQCYKNLCKHILTTPMVYASMHKYLHVDGSSATAGPEANRNLAELIDEGAQFQDEYKSNAGLTKSAFSILPFIFSSTVAATSSNNTVSTVTSPVAPTTTTRVAVATVTSPATTISTSIEHQKQQQQHRLIRIQQQHQSKLHHLQPQPTIVRTISHPQPVISTGNCVVSMASASGKGERIFMTSPNLIKNPAIKTVSNGSTMYSVLYSGAGNKITIKRKPDDMNSIVTSTTSTGTLRPPTTTTVLLATPTPIISTSNSLPTSICVTPTMTTSLVNPLSTSNMINVLSLNPPPKIQQLPQIQQAQPQISLQQLQPIVPQQFQIGVR